MLLTVHKAGSSYVGEIFKEVFARHRYQPFDLMAEVYSGARRMGDWSEAEAERLCTSGGFFGPFRGGHNGLAAHISQARPIIHVRDPRDCIVSHYYSMRYSHGVPPGYEGERLLALRESLECTTIDSYVENLVICGLCGDENFCRSFDILHAIRCARPDAILSRYEDMVTEFPDWLVGIVEQFGIEIDYEMVIDLIARTNFLVNLRVEENQYNHKRQITPGDFQRKLSPRGQALLTAHFAETLDAFGYT
ncbi:MAG: sulfotransferase domain-containing protein [Aliidongia sp.]